MCYTKKDRDDLEKESRRITESRLMEEEACQRHEDHQRRRREQEEETKPLTEKIKEVVGVGYEAHTTNEREGKRPREYRGLFLARRE